ncbi:outer membrane beta-barrel protein [Roseomonas eburnea]|uniref:Outer membrane beta-barrel protein n=1 Tax=Neoroseomonas eburnea TaxID=1346889 RepID=A0A9X9X5Q9_9PROT|nr:outer membrane beta-barrel protein [Neoroseomonas eburnea]MBR0679045.1 outer membrane beta-barrel protein [Neoroseomonas eburnea]
MRSASPAMRPPAPAQGRVAAVIPALLALFAWSATASAQDEASMGPTPDRGSTVMGRSRPEVDPAGVRLGSFRFDASATTGVGYDDNLLGTSTSRLADGFAEFGAQGAIVSEWTQHHLGVEAGILNRTYFNEGNFDWTDWNVGVSGRYDLAANASLSAGYAHRRLHLDPQSVDVQQAGLVQPVPYNVDELSLGGTTTLNRVTLGLSASYGMYRYDNVSGPGGNASGSDYDSLTVRFDTAYEFVQGRSLTLGLRYQDIDYRAAEASDRESQTYAALVGFKYDFDGVWSARIAVGYARREYSGAQFKPLDSPAVDIAVTWNVTALTTVNLSASRSIQESIRSNTASYVSNYGQLRVDHELYRNIVISGIVGLNGQEYQQPTQRGTDLVLGAQAMWLMNRNLALTLDYQYVNRVQHTGGLAEYQENVVFLRMRVAL